MTPEELHKLTSQELLDMIDKYLGTVWSKPSPECLVTITKSDLRKIREAVIQMAIVQEETSEARNDAHSGAEFWRGEAGRWHEKYSKLKEGEEWEGNGP